MPRCGDPRCSFSQATNHEAQTPRAAEPGRQGALGDHAKPPPGKLANVDPTTGEFFDRADTAKVMKQQFRELQNRREQQHEDIDEPPTAYEA